MNVIDLTMPLTHGMPVYPGDPEVVIEEIHTLPNEGWSLRQLTVTTHIGTHVNVPSHMVADGKTLEQIPLDIFFGPARIYTKNMHLPPHTGIIFRDQNIDEEIATWCIKTKPSFVGLSSAHNFDIALEKLLLEHGIISYENLVHTDKLSETFTFYGLPLNLPGADGSPVRAIALLTH